MADRLLLPNIMDNIRSYVGVVDIVTAPPSLPPLSEGVVVKEEETKVSVVKKFHPAAIHSLLQSPLINYCIIDHFLGPSVHSVLKEVHELRVKEGLMKAGGMGSEASSRWVQPVYRGDMVVWLTSLPSLPPAIEGLLRQFHRVRDYFATVAPHLQLTQRLSFQLACYPGGGSGYTKHVDVQQTSDGKERRKLTFVYYLNKDWQESDGGHLRLYLPRGPSLPPSSSSGVDVEPILDYLPRGPSLPPSSSSGVDVEPILDRLLVFQSEVVEHEVLPAYKDRYAITCWMYGAGGSDENVVPTAISGTSVSGDKVGEGGRDDDAQTATMFISIISYRDPDCHATIIDMYRQAQYPHRLRVGVVYQCDKTRDQRCYLPPLPPSLQVKTIHLSHHEARGPSWARHLCQSLYEGEKYYLQIDSHMRFEEHWDTLLIRELMRCPSVNSVLTTYPPDFERGEGSNSRTMVEYEGREGAICGDNAPASTSTDVPYEGEGGSDIDLDDIDEGPPMQSFLSRIPLHTPLSTFPYSKPPPPHPSVSQDKFPVVLKASHFGDDAMLRIKGSKLDYFPPAPVRTLFYAAGFHFSIGKVIAECPYDPHHKMLFFGEESAMAVRLFTHGYDLYCPSRPMIWHHWSRDYRPSFREGSTPELLSMELTAKRRVFHLLCVDTIEDLEDPALVDFANYALGTVRPFSCYLQEAGVDFKSRVVHEQMM